MYINIVYVFIKNIKGEIDKLLHVAINIYGQSHFDHKFNLLSNFPSFPTFPYLFPYFSFAFSWFFLLG